MSNTDKICGAIIGNAVCTAGWLQDMENIVSIVCCIAGFLITLVTCVIVPVWKKIQKARKDGVITPDELEEIAGTLQDGLDSINKEKKDK